MAGQRCSFCGKPRDQVDYLVAGPDDLAICDECADLAGRVAREGMRASGDDLLLVGVSTAVTNDRRVEGPLGVVENAAIAVKAGRISWIGPERELPRRYSALPRHDCGGRAVVPGMIDASTRLLDDHDEGAVSAAAGFAGRMLARGTTGLGLEVGGTADPAAEARWLTAAGRLAERAPSTVSITWRVSSPELARVAGPAASRVAGFAAIACEGLADGRAGRLARAVAPLATRLRTCARSACRCWEGVEPVTADGPQALDTGGIPILTAEDLVAGRFTERIVSDERAFALASWSRVSARRLEGMAHLVALAVDLAGMPFEVALWGVTRGGALAIGDPERGRLRLGAPGDILVIDGARPSAILDRPDGDIAWRVVLGGAFIPR